MADEDTTSLALPSEVDLARECDLLITRHQVRVSLEARLESSPLSTADWIERVVDRVAADLVPKYGLSRESFLALFKEVYRSRAGG